MSTIDYTNRSDTRVVSDAHPLSELVHTGRTGMPIFSSARAGSSKQLRSHLPELERSLRERSSCRVRPRMKEGQILAMGWARTDEIGRSDSRRLGEEKQRAYVVRVTC